ncbi:putative transposase/invertase (TIGR01784 family) [Kluyvera sp. 1366]
MNHRSMAALTLLQKHIHRRDLADLLDRLAATLMAGHLTGQQLVSLINYLVQAGETDDAEAFVRNLAQRVPQHEDELMTIAQQLEQKGLEKGRMEGRQEGKMEVARNLLAKGIPLESVRELTGLSDDDLAKIRH